MSMETASLVLARYAHMAYEAGLHEEANSYGYSSTRLLNASISERVKFVRVYESALDSMREALVEYQRTGKVEDMAELMDAIDLMINGDEDA